MHGPTIIDELGEDADLVLHPDKWLENHRVALQQRMSELAEELDAVLRSLRAKRQLQQQNLVPVRCLERDQAGVPLGVVIRVLPLPEAIAVLDRDRTDPALPKEVVAASAAQQEKTWECDGYDVRGARKLRRKYA